MIRAFTNHKVEIVEQNIKSHYKLKQDSFLAYRTKQIEKEQYLHSLRALHEELIEFKNEESVLKTQRKSFEEDLAEEMHQYANINEAYRYIIISKTGLASRSKCQRKLDKRTSHRNVKHFYDNARQVSQFEEFDVLFGWVAYAMSSSRSSPQVSQIQRTPSSFWCR